MQNNDELPCFKCGKTHRADPTRGEDLLAVFKKAYEYVTTNHPEDLEEAREFLKINIEEVSKEFFFRQYVHVVYCSGFRYATVKAKWPEIEKTYLNFDYSKVTKHGMFVEQQASKIINHKGKIKAILRTARLLHTTPDDRFTMFLRRVKTDIDTLTELSYIGDVTKYHLGFCLGLDVAKPDVHVQRLADHYRTDPLSMVQQLAKATKQPVRIVDAVIWRASEQGVIHWVNPE